MTFPLNGLKKKTTTGTFGMGNWTASIQTDWMFIGFRFKRLYFLILSTATR